MVMAQVLVYAQDKMVSGKIVSATVSRCSVTVGVKNSDKKTTTGPMEFQFNR